MKLHTTKEFQTLIKITSDYKRIPESAVERDYFIVFVLQRLSQSKYGDECVFKGGTSLSKCYPHSIERFSEDIDLTYFKIENLSPKQISKKLKRIETLMTDGFNFSPNNDERSNTNKSSFFWYDDEEKRIKLEVGTSARPDPFSKKCIKTYIQEFLEDKGYFDEIEEFDLSEFKINTLNIERTFIDKILAVKRHVFCGQINEKVRHIYDVMRLYELDEIQNFLNNTDELKRLIKITKESDVSYFEKRPIPKNYNPISKYNFDSWCNKLDENVKNNYENLHKDLLYTTQKQDFQKAFQTFEKINQLFKTLGE